MTRMAMILLAAKAMYHAACVGAAPAGTDPDEWPGEDETWNDADNATRSQYLSMAHAAYLALSEHSAELRRIRGGSCLCRKELQRDSAVDTFEVAAHAGAEAQMVTVRGTQCNRCGGEV